MVSGLLPAHADMPHNTGVKYFASNPSQQITARFMSDGQVKIQSGIAGHDWSVVLSHGERHAPPAKISNARVEIPLGDTLVEWYENKPSGIEHGFSVLSPAADTDQEEPGLQLSLDVSGDLRVAGAPNHLRFVDHDGDPVLGYEKLLAWDASGRLLEAKMEASQGGESIRYFVDTATARFPVTIDPMIFSYEREFDPVGAATAATELGFGDSICVDGNTCLVGAPYQSVSGRVAAGRAYILHREEGIWAVHQTIWPSDHSENPRFGSAVSLSGTTAIVGSYLDKSTGSVGSAYVFSLQEGNWIQTQKLEAADGGSGDGFGLALELEGDTALIGAPQIILPSGNGVGAVYVFERQDGVWSQQQKLVASDGVIDDSFGMSLSLHGDTALVGAPGHNDDAGSVYVFGKGASSWSEDQKLIATDSSRRDAFGCSVSLDGDTALIGACRGNGRRTDSGSAYVFGLVNDSWQQQQELSASDASFGDAFGSAVSLNGGAVLVGAPDDDDSSVQDSGSAYIFVSEDGEWQQQQKLAKEGGFTNGSFGSAVWLGEDMAFVGSPSDAGAPGHNEGSLFVFERSLEVWSQSQRVDNGASAVMDYFGSRLDFDGSTLLISSPGDDTAAGANVGSAHVFVNVDGWEFQQRLEAADAAGGDGFGGAVALDGDTALIGAHEDGDFDHGSAYVFVRDGAVWTEQKKLIDATGSRMDWFGRAVAIRGDIALVGAPFVDEGFSSDFGKAFIFARSNGDWQLQDTIVADDRSFGDIFGITVALGDGVAMVGAYRTDTEAGSDSGSVYVFSSGVGGWSQSQELAATDADLADVFGWSISIDGDTALIGARNGDGAQLRAGSAYAFVNQGGTWVEQGKLIAPDGDKYELFGASVDLDGDIAVVGAPGDDTMFGESTGSAYLFAREGQSWAFLQKLEATERTPNDWFGSSVGVSGDLVVVGATRHDRTSGGAISVDQGSVSLFRLREISPIEDWRQTFFNTTANTGISADSNDANGNGLPNLLDFAFLIDPVAQIPLGAIVVDDQGLLIQRGIPTIDQSDDPLTLQYLQRADHVEAGVTYTPQFSSNLADWFDDLTPPSLIGSDLEMDLLAIPFPPVLPNGQPARFGRVKVELD